MGGNNNNWLCIAERHLKARDFFGAKALGTRIKETDPGNALSDQILAVVDTVMAGEKRVNSLKHPDWYSVLQLPQLVSEVELILASYKRLVALLNPDRNRLPFAGYALQLTMDAWRILSDVRKKRLFDNELGVYLQRKQFDQVGFMQPPPMQQRELPPQWQMRDPTPVKGGGRNKGVVSVNGLGDGIADTNVATPMRQVADVAVMTPAQTPPPRPAPPQHSILVPGRVPTGIADVARRLPAGIGITRGIDGNVGLNNVVNHSDVSISSANVAVPGSMVTTPTQTPPPRPSPPPAPPAPPQHSILVPGVGVNNIVNDSDVSISNAGVVHDDNDNDNVVNDHANVDDCVVNESSDKEKEEEEERVESFWTYCPYCLYTYEYQKMYLECTLRCQNCRRGFQAVQITNPPPISGGGGGRGVKGKEICSFCCWGFYPLGFSSVQWKKRMEKSEGANWVPFSPMVASPVEKPKVSVVDKDSDFDDFDSDSDPNDYDSSDKDWRRKPALEKKRKMKKIGRPPKKVKRTQNVGVGGRVTRSQARRKAESTGRLDLNVEFNNEGDENASTVNVANGGQDGVENIEFFEGLDEFLSTLPILNAAEDEKAKPPS